MAAVFYMGELESENEVSPFSLEQLEMKDLTTVFSCDVEEIINVQQQKNITVLIMQQSVYGGTVSFTRCGDI